MAKYTVVIQDEEGDDLLRVEDVEAEYLDIAARACVEDILGTPFRNRRDALMLVALDARDLVGELEDEADSIKEGPF